MCSKISQIVKGKNEFGLEVIVLKRYFMANGAWKARTTIEVGSVREAIKECIQGALEDIVYLAKHPRQDGTTGKATMKIAVEDNPGAEVFEAIRMLNGPMLNIELTKSFELPAIAPRKVFTKPTSNVPTNVQAALEATDKGDGFTNWVARKIAEGGDCTLVAQKLNCEATWDAVKAAAAKLGEKPAEKAAAIPGVTEKPKARKHAPAKV
jgi:hypothetical protein